MTTDQHHPETCDGCVVLLIETERKRLAVEVDRLRAVIAEAPHDRDTCACCQPDDLTGDCTCWKAEALEGSE